MSGDITDPRLRILAIVPDFPSLEDVVAGDRVRSLELLTALAGPDCHVEVCILSDGTKRHVGGPHLRVASTPVADRRISDLPALVSLGLVLRRHARLARSLGERPVLYIKLPAGIYLRGGVVPVHSSPVHLLVPLARKMGFLIWSTAHDLQPDHDHAVLARRTRNGEQISPALRRGIRWSAAIGGAEMNWVFRRSHLITVVSEGMREAVVRRSGVGADRVLVATTGVNPILVEGIPDWSPPAPGQHVTVAYVGSPYDVELHVLLESVCRAAERSERRMTLRLSTEPPSLAPLTPLVSVEVRSSRYSTFAHDASEVDIWLNCFASDDRYIMEMGSPLKLPMYLASGRPTATTAGPYLDRDGLAAWAMPAAPTQAGLEDAVASILDDVESAARRARAARDHLLRHRTWSRTARTIAEHLQAAATENA